MKEHKETNSTHYAEWMLLDDLLGSSSDNIYM